MFKYLLPLLMVSALSAAEEVAHKNKVVSIGRNNADLVADKIRHNAGKSSVHQHNYLLALYQAGKPDIASKFFKTMDSEHVSKASRLIYVRCLLDRGLARNAYIELKKADDPKKPDVHIELLRAKILIKLKEWKAARAVLQMVLRVAPSSSEAHYYYALTCPAVGQYTEAIAHCNSVWEHAEPNSKVSRLAGALMLVSLKKMETLKR